jgi:hypothetical protein
MTTEINYLHKPGEKPVKVEVVNRGEGEIKGNTPPNHELVDVFPRRGIIYRIFHLKS